METVHVYARMLRQFGRPLRLRDQDDVQDRKGDVKADESIIVQDYISKNPVDAATQKGTEMSTNETNTENVKVESRAMNHVEGGWPKDINISEAEPMIRFRKKVEKDMEYIQIVQNLCRTMEYGIKENNSIDIYEEYFPEESGFLDGPAEIKVVNTFKDQHSIGRPISSISWSQSNTFKIAAAHSIVDFQRGEKNMQYDSYVWDISSPKKPDFVIKSPSPIVTLDFYPKDMSSLAGGLLNGQVAFWDLRKGSQPVEVSDLDHSHKFAVRQLIYLSAKSGTEFFTTSTDGTVMWWDVRKMKEPCTTLELCNERFGKDKYGGTCLEYDPTQSTRFKVGTEQGRILTGNRKGKSPADMLMNMFSGHTSPVHTVQRNPLAKETFLSIAGWMCHIWSEDIKEAPLLSTRLDEAYLLDGCWSPTRPAVFMTAKSDGVLDVWDISRDQKNPFASKKVSESALQAVKIQGNGEMLATGARDGSLTVMEFSRVLSTPYAGEKPYYASVIEREIHREKLREGFRRDQRLREKIERAKQSAPAPEIPPPVVEEEKKKKKDPIEQVNLYDTVFKTDYREDWTELRNKRIERKKNASDMAALIARKATPDERDEREIMELNAPVISIHLPKGM
eukprot:scpid41947/ scgid15824/ Dynein intermediate chain 3, ciliary